MLLNVFDSLTGDAECVRGSCTNGKCGIVEGQVSCVCNIAFVKDKRGICVKTGELFFGNSRWIGARHLGKDNISQTSVVVIFYFVLSSLAQKTGKLHQHHAITVGELS